MAAFTLSALFGATAAATAAGTAASTALTASLIAADVAMLGAGIAAGGQVMSGQASAAQGRQMAAQEQLNAGIGRQNAQAIEQAGAFEADKQRIENRRLVGRQRALTAGSGVRFTGSPLDVMSDTIAMQEMDLASLRYNTEIAKRRALSGADYNDFLAGQYKEMGSIGQTEGYIKAGSTLLSEGANIANKYGGAFKYKGDIK